MAGMTVPLRVADRPWNEIAQILLPEDDAAASEEPVVPPPPVQDDAPRCDLTVMLMPESAAARYADAKGTICPVHKVLVGAEADCDEDTLGLLYGGRGADCRALLRLRLLTALDQSLEADCTVVFSDGSEFPAHRAILATRSDWFDAALRSPIGAAAEEGPQRVRLPLERRAASGEAARLLLRYLYTQDAREMEELVNCSDDEEAAGDAPPLVVDMAFLADELLLDELREHLLACLTSAVTEANAPSLLRVAEELEGGCRLQQACLSCIITAGVDAVRLACGSAIFDAVVPATEREQMRSLSLLARSNPLCCGIELTDAREALAMIREALGEQRERLDASLKRHAETSFLKQGSTSEDLRTETRLRKILASQRRRLDCLSDFAIKQERLFFGDPSGLSYEWQPMHEDASLPAGLEVRVDLSGNGRRMVKIPASWSLKLYVPDWRTLSFVVDRATSVDKILNQVKEALVGKDAAAYSDVAVTLHNSHGTLDPTRLFDAALWADRTHLRLTIL